ncbi:MAG TPA: hypothetical protein VM240_11670 [Verrucomicrobiae bacterium]|nr:hypothetical protein [Verrucomicrobiae bacterium]
MSAPADDRKHWLEPPEWWKKSKPLRWVPILIGIAVVAPGLWVAKKTLAPGGHPEKARFTEVAADPVVLLDNLSSYSSVEAARAALDAVRTPYTVAPVRPAPSSKYPPRDRDTVLAAGYRHLGVEGQLTLEFFNDRLYEATFIPSDAGDYGDKLHKADTRLKRDRNGRAERIIGNLRIASNVDFADTDVGRSLQTKPYVIWQDVRLVQQLDEWDQRFIALPGKSAP